MTFAQARSMGKQLLVKPSKYKNVKTTVDGIVFDSAKEARRYQELKMLRLASKISQLETQPEYELTVETPNRGRAPIGYYLADFRYFDIAEGITIVEDAKGFRTPLYRWKKKHVEAQYGIQIREL